MHTAQGLLVHGGMLSGLTDPMVSTPTARAQAAAMAARDYDCNYDDAAGDSHGQGNGDLPPCGGDNCCGGSMVAGVLSVLSEELDRHRKHSNNGLDPCYRHHDHSLPLQAQVTLCGHSLGGGYAAICAAHLIGRERRRRQRQRQQDRSGQFEADGVSTGRQVGYATQPSSQAKIRVHTFGAPQVVLREQLGFGPHKHPVWRELQVCNVFCLVGYWNIMGHRGISR